MLYAVAWTLLKLVTMGQRSRSQWHNYHFFFIILCWLPYLVSQLFYVWSKWNSVCHLDIPSVDFCLNFIKFEWEMTWFKFSLNNCRPYLRFYWTYKLRNWNQYTTIKCPSYNNNESDLDGRWRSQAKVKGNKKWTNRHMSQTITLTDIIPGTYVQYNKRWHKPIWPSIYDQ